VTGFFRGSYQKKVFGLVDPPSDRSHPHPHPPRPPPPHTSPPPLDPPHRAPPPPPLPPTPYLSPLVLYFSVDPPSPLADSIDGRGRGICPAVRIPFHRGFHRLDPSQPLYSLRTYGVSHGSWTSGVWFVPKTFLPVPFPSPFTFLKSALFRFFSALRKIPSGTSRCSGPIRSLPPRDLRTSPPGIDVSVPLNFSPPHKYGPDPSRSSQGPESSLSTLVLSSVSFRELRTPPPTANPTPDYCN